MLQICSSEDTREFSPVHVNMFSIVAFGGATSPFCLCFLTRNHLFPFQNIYILLTHSIQLTCHCTVGSCLANIYLASVTTFKQPSQVSNDTDNPSRNSAHPWHPRSAALAVAGLQEPNSLPRERGAFLVSVAGICKCLKHSNKEKGFPHVVNRFYQSICAQIPPQTHMYNL